ncbi:putative RNA-directed DNA polymerase [Tanacetum coccineum]|uniref:RNA-directed DNA polymerase n=1 Tax=Tanacetum coccineum TaxID=301880 RepID=A0ABQ4WMX1_9ASTR
MERGFLTSKWSGGRGVKEKSGGSIGVLLRVDVVVPVESIRAISERFANKAYGFFLVKRVAYPVVANYVRNTWGKYDLVKSMLNSLTGILSFQFSSMEGLDAILETGSWFLRNNPLILKKWNSDVNLLKEDVGNVPVKLHGVLSSYARALIEVRADVELKGNIVVAMTKLVGEGFYTCNVRVEYEWKPPRCMCCKVFGHVQDECPKNKVSDVVKNMKKPSQTPRGVLVGPKVGFQPTKQVYRQVSKKTMSALVVIRRNMWSLQKRTSNLSNKKANSNGFSFWNAESSSTSTTHIVEKIDKMERLIIHGTAILVDDEGILLKIVNSSGDHDSDDEVSAVDNDMANF